MNQPQFIYKEGGGGPSKSDDSSLSPGTPLKSSGGIRLLKLDPLGRDEHIFYAMAGESLIWVRVWFLRAGVL